ncbi:hypothetical protein ACU686_26390 [Yinghuangia aomiensis]
MHNHERDEVPARRRWTPEEESAFEQARGIITQVVAAYSEHLADAADDEKRGLEAEQLTYSMELRRLAVTDRADVARILRDYPAVLKRLAPR